MVITKAQVRNALDWQSKNQDQVNKMLKKTEYSAEPSPVVANNPERWVGAHWKFLTERAAADKH